MVTRTSTSSPLRTGFAHLDLPCVGPERAVRELGDGDHPLRAVQPHAGAHLRLAGSRPEVAAAGGKDPINLRMQLLAGDTRAQTVIREALDMAGWTRKRPAGRALGFAYSDIWETYIAQVAEVSVDRKSGRITVHEVWSAVDTGVALQPKNIQTQIESSVIWGLSALRERLDYKDGVPRSRTSTTTRSCA